MTSAQTLPSQSYGTSFHYEPMTLDMECQRQIGNERYIFFYPKNIGNFVVSCWTCQRTQGSSRPIDQTKKELPSGYETGASDRKMYGITIYEDGEIIDPSQDERMTNANVAWISPNKDWANQSFSRAELFQLFTDLYKFSSINK